MMSQCVVPTADLVALSRQVRPMNSVAYATPPQTWSRCPADLVADEWISPQTWSRFTADLVAPYIEQNTTEHFSRTSFKNSEQAAF